MKDRTHMSMFNRPFLLFLLATLLTIAPGCVPTQLISTTRTHMTVHQARRSLTESLSHLKNYGSVREVKINRHGVAFAASRKEDGMILNCFVSFSEMNNLSVETWASWVSVRTNGEPVLSKEGDDGFETEHYAMMFVDALLNLKAAASAPDTEEADFAAFAAGAKTWLVATSKPAMPDEALTYKALAEDAFKRKDLSAALDGYCDALDKYPMWPEGHYNAALLAAETEDYELAALHMRRYLVLAPGAKDAAAAKEKFLLWQHKAKE
jgi:hypothetical protein